MRSLDILHSQAMAGSPYHIPPFTIGAKRLRPVPTSPLVKLQDLADAEAAIAALSELLALAGPQLVAAIVDVEKFARWFLEYRGFPMHLIKKVEDVLKERVLAQRAAQVAAAQQGAAPAGAEVGPAVPQPAPGAGAPPLAALAQAADMGGAANG